MVKAKKRVDKSVSNNFIKKPFLYGGIAYIILFFIGLASDSLNFLFPSFTPYFLMVVSVVCYIFAFNALFVLGTVYDSKLLRVLSIIAMIFSVVFSVTFLVSPFVFQNQISTMNETLVSYNQTISNANYTEAELNELSGQFIGEIFNVLMPFLIVLGILAFLFFIYVIFFGVSLIKLGDKVRYAKVAGILNIVGVCTLILIIGIFVLIAASILEIMMLFDQAKKFKEIK